MSSAQSSSEIGGSDEHWSNSRPGAVFEEMTEGAVANPLFLLDEIDKIADRYKEAAGALYQLFEGHTARIFRDRSVPWLPIDASHANWLATANLPEDIEPALLSRFRVHHVQQPTAEQQRGLIQRIYALMLDELGLTDRFPPQLRAEAVERLAAGSARELRQAIRQAAVHAIRLEHAELSIALPQTLGPKRPVGFIWNEEA
jgi:ATP-dependent Lon protease